MRILNVLLSVLRNRLACFDEHRRVYVVHCTEVSSSPQSSDNSAFQLIAN